MIPTRFENKSGLRSFLECLWKPVVVRKSEEGGDGGGGLTRRCDESEQKEKSFECAAHNQCPPL